MRNLPFGFLRKGSLPEADILKIIESRHHDPFQVLGRHPLDGTKRPRWIVRAFFPNAATVSVQYNDHSVGELTQIHRDGFFEGIFPEHLLPDNHYQLIVRYPDGSIHTISDAYSKLPIITEYDLYLWSQGNHYRIYEKLGAHPLVVEGEAGYHFAVWAPGAKRLSVVGDFNLWDGRRHTMRVLGSSGIWEIFIPGFASHTLYKFEIKTGSNDILLKSDPFANQTELRPKTASVTTDINAYAWHDSKWMKNRGHLPDNRDIALSIYEVHLGSWRRKNENEYLPYTELAKELVAHVQALGFTHIELLPVNEHPFDASWGYQVTGYFAPTSRFGSPEDFMYFVDYCHRNGIGVILDWVPAHFPKDSFSLSNFDGTALFEHSDPRQGEHPDWGTKIFNYGRNEVRNFLIASAHFWIEKYHIDGLRVDAVASMLYLDYSRKANEWIPNRYGGRENLEAIDFLKQLNESVYQQFPGVVTIAEESTTWPGVSRPVYAGGLGFGMKWNMGWMHDILEYFEEDPIHRRFHHDNLTFGLMYAFQENFVLPLSHDEVVHGKKSLLAKMPGSYEEQFANMRLLLGFMWTYPGKKLLFMGSEFGQWDEWNSDSGLDWNLLEFPIHKGLMHWVKALNQLMQQEPALHSVDFTQSGFQWIDFHDVENSVISYRRQVADTLQPVITICNFTPVKRTNYRMWVPQAGKYEILLNSDQNGFGGWGNGSTGIISTEETGNAGSGHLVLTLPPLGVLILRKVRN